MDIIVKPFKKHKQLKKTFLKLINEIPKSTEESIYNTDWYLPRDYTRKYLDLFYENIGEHMQSLAEDFNCHRWEITNGWFQQYKKGSEHDWHNHAGHQLANVYYLELPDVSAKTELLNKKTPKISEGDILTFPAYIPHRSAINKTNKLKTVIAFNSNLLHGLLYHGEDTTT